MSDLNPSGGMGMETCEEQNARLHARIAELEAKLAEAEGIISASPAVQKAMGRFHDGLAKRRIAELEAELKGMADLWPAAPTMIGTSKGWNDGFVAGLEAFRASIRRTIAERSKA